MLPARTHPNLVSNTIVDPGGPYYWPFSLQSTKLQYQEEDQYTLDIQSQGQQVRFLRGEVKDTGCKGRSQVTCMMIMDVTSIFSPGEYTVATLKLVID